MEILEKIAPYISYLWILIALLTIWAWIWIKAQQGKPSLLAKRRWIEMIPSGISTLGVLGTFAGITIGLLCFDTQNLESSIPKLLEGLKTAFFTSLAGMIGSLLLSRLVNKLFDEATGGVSDINQAAGQIVQSVADFQEQTTQQQKQQQVFYNLMQTLIQQMDANISSMNANINSLNVAANNIAIKMDDVCNLVSSTASAASEAVHTTSQIENNTRYLGQVSNSIASSLGNIEEGTNKQLNASRDIDNRIGEMMDHTEAIASTENEVSEKITSLTDKLHSEVIDIEEKMASTNALLSQKFDEFSELLKKNNTEALVEVMKKVTEEFQKQMNELISKLVQENFEQLNTSVERLNTWQVENKEMIASLTAQYKQMSDNFENTSDALSHVKDDTKALVSDGGKLQELVTALNEVIIEDEKFKAISSDLQTSAELTKQNTDAFSESTQKLNEWVRSQMHFREDVAVLIQKLQEINEIRDYASSFWEETREGMDDAVSLIQNGTEHLNQQITTIDQHFYERLSATLAELDACIQSLVANAQQNNR